MATTNQMILPLVKDVASAKQVSFITSLLNTRKIDADLAAALETDLPRMTKKEASSTIDFLVSKPKR